MPNYKISKRGDDDVLERPDKLPTRRILPRSPKEEAITEAEGEPEVKEKKPSVIGQVLKHALGTYAMGADKYIPMVEEMKEREKDRKARKEEMQSKKKAAEEKVTRRDILLDKVDRGTASPAEEEELRKINKARVYRDEDAIERLIEDKLSKRK